jgi:hypothetical protein
MSNGKGVKFCEMACKSMLFLQSHKNKPKDLVDISQEAG